MLDVMDEEFWDKYTDRQPRTDTAAHLKELLQPWLPQIRSVLEVGCNRGDNLEAFDGIVRGTEPNAHARRQALHAGYMVFPDRADKLKFGTASFDLVFTMGVLIHIPPEELDESLRGIHRISGRFILAVEYDAPSPIPVDYRGVRAGIWKRPYGHEYLSRFKDITPVKMGAFMDDCKFWLFEKE